MEKATPSSTVILLLLFALMPFLAPILGEAFYVDVFARIMIWSIAAVGLNLILGYGGMVSFGHAAYIGIGGYTIAIFSFHEINNGFIQWPVALAISGAVALLFGALSLRTKGVYFIMITLAFAQMIYFLGVSADKYGSNDGLNVWHRSHFKLGNVNFKIDDNITFYYVIFFLLLLVIYFTRRLVNSRFGMVLKGSRSNEVRLNTVGIRTYSYRLTAFVISGVICGLAGVLQANFEKFVSPDMMDWPRSGELMFMVIMGGLGTVFGPVMGATAYLVLSEILSSFTIHWHLIFGPLLIILVLYGRGGLSGLFGKSND
ncbi:MAG: branched-chain amino acid ABC transporter permease [Rhodospirillaceae bacterium]|nr:branched-chain amino acid ABC transporter permease [Rhodospirillaceae bacterium]|tara:strand:+ start:199 stop:1143 length:945 start_codon:yes stop_codon:yes gene_type:complete